MIKSCRGVADVNPPPSYRESDAQKRSELDLDKESAWPSVRLFLTGLIVVLGGSFHFGFQISLINPMAEVFKEFIVESFVTRFDLDINGIIWKIIWPTVAGILFVGCTLGAFAATPLMERLGSKFVLMTSSLILITSFLLSVGSKLFGMAELFIVSRLISGVGIGMITTTSGVYLTEIAPISLRGFMGTMIGFSTNIGFVSASALGLSQLLGHSDRWQYAYALEVLPCVILFLSTFFFFYESPFFLLRTNKRSEAAEAVLIFRGSITDNYKLERILRAMEHELSESSQSRSRWRDLLQNGGVRWAAIIAATVNATVSFSGIMAVSFFGTFLLQAIGFTENGAAMANFLASFSGTAGAILSSLVVDKLGRRSLLIGSLIALALINVLMMLNTVIFLNYNIVCTGYVFLVFFVVFLFVFSFGVGPLAWFVSTELTLPAHRPKVQSVAVASQYISCFLSPLFFYPLQNLFGPLSFLIFIVPPAFTAGFLYYTLPETRNRPTEEIVRELEGRTDEAKH
ncbi:hypothetical protein L596_011011 [Steinernema carpocapsae]|uniref:Major facilitator superfamily (MFS) profile domain-containing protein n=1 Tax=Steinernema carpocapsae TaxID=34508 RepID=A0A4V6A4B5_STECR|nr:hypothetical protein L596_011011 [Steinernema carpocapsae]